MGIDIDANALVEKLQPAFEKMADKLGVGVTKVWAIMIKQAYVEAIYTISVLVILYATLTIFGIWCYKLGKKANFEWSEPKTWNIMFIVICIVGLFVFIGTLMELKNLVTIFANTEYYVLKQLLNMVR